MNGRGSGERVGFSSKSEIEPKGSQRPQLRGRVGPILFNNTVLYEVSDRSDSEGSQVHRRPYPRVHSSKRTSSQPLRIRRIIVAELKRLGRELSNCRWLLRVMRMLSAIGQLVT